MEGGRKRPSPATLSLLQTLYEPHLDGVPAIPRGEKMGGQFFPLLFDPASM